MQVYFATQTSRDITAQTNVDDELRKQRCYCFCEGLETVTVTVKLSDALRKELHGDVENGIYIEGYITLNSRQRPGSTGCAPFLSPTLPSTATGIRPRHRHRLLLAEAGGPNWASQYLNYGGSMLSGTGSFYVFGGNPYAPELAYYPEHNTLSPLRTDGYYDKVDRLQALLRFLMQSP